MQVVTREMIEALLEEHKALLDPPRSTGLADVKRKADAYYAERVAFDLPAWIARHLPDAKERSWNEGRKWILPVCPFNPEHDRGEACVVQLASGAVSAKCQHDSCVWGWTDLRGKYEPEYAERRDRAVEPRRRTTDREPPPEVVYEDRSYRAEISSVEAEYDRIADEDRRTDAPAEPPPVLWLRGPDLVRAILERANDPWIALTLGGDELARLRVGATAVVMGGSGSGKSSLTACFLVEHAKHVGPAIALSIELPAEEFGARIVGQRCDAGWEDALRGRVATPEMERALGLPRLFVLDRRRANLENLEKAIDAARAEFPGEPILVAIDYAQLLDSREREIRQRVADVFAQIDDVAREKRVVVIALSQMSRANADKARKGDAIGAESAALGAEASAIERFATLTVSIGLAAEREDGSSAVELSLGKWRMGKGDRVLPMTYHGRTGLWRVAGEAKTAEAVREQRDAERVRREHTAVEKQIVGIAVTADQPLTREQICEAVGGRRGKVKQIIAELVGRGDLVEIAKHPPRSRSWLIWTVDRAQAAGAPLVRDSLFHEGDRR
jgi:hypothetical protein